MPSFKDKTTRLTAGQATVVFVVYPGVEAVEKPI